jgi:hypothetical protein
VTDASSSGRRSSPRPVQPYPRRCAHRDACPVARVYRTRRVGLVDAAARRAGAQNLAAGRSRRAKPVTSSTQGRQQPARRSRTWRSFGTAFHAGLRRGSSSGGRHSGSGACGARVGAQARRAISRQVRIPRSPEFYMRLHPGAAAPTSMPPSSRRGCCAACVLTARRLDAGTRARLVDGARVHGSDLSHRRSYNWLQFAATVEAALPSAHGAAGDAASRQRAAAASSSGTRETGITATARRSTDQLPQLVIQPMSDRRARLRAARKYAAWKALDDARPRARARHAAIQEGSSPEDLIPRSAVASRTHRGVPPAGAAERVRRRCR